MTDPTTPATQAQTPAQQPAQPAPHHPAVVTTSATPSIPLEYYQRDRDELQREKAERSRIESENKKLSVAFEETKAALAKLNEQFGTSEAEKKRMADERRAEKIRFEARLAATDAVDPDDVVALILPRLTMSEDGKVIANDDTKASVNDVVKSFLEKKPHLAKPRTAQGSGASPFTAAAPSAPSQKNFDMTTREGATEWLRSGVASMLTTQPAKP